jgi:late competence protein required for DNA uptake (superfamily II DNA/RNA helicase)
MLEKLKFWKKAPVEAPAPPAPPSPLLTTKGIACSKCGLKAFTFVTMANGARYCVKCFTLLSARRPVS